MQRIKGVLKGIVTAMISSVVMILISALLMLTMKLNDSSLKVLVGATYFVASFLGGIVTAKAGKTKKYIWGMTCGVLYFMIILIMSLIVPERETTNVLNATSCLLICVLAGCFGGMMGT